MTHFALILLAKYNMCKWCHFLTNQLWIRSLTMFMIDNRHVCALRRRQMAVMASRITEQSSVCSTVYSDWQQRNIKYQHCYSFVRGIHRLTVVSSDKGTATWIFFPFHGVILTWWLDKEMTDQFEHIKTDTNLPTFCRRHFHVHYLNENVWFPIKNDKGSFLIVQ